MSHGDEIQSPIIFLPILISAHSITQGTSHTLHFTLMHNKPQDNVQLDNILVSLIRGRGIRRMTPLAHLQYSDEKKRVNSKKSRRKCDAPYLLSALCGIAEVVCVWKGLQMAVESYGTLNCKVRQDPITRCEWSRIPQEAINETPNTNFLPCDIVVIKPKVVIFLQPGNVQPVINNHSYTTQLQQTYGLQGFAILRPEETWKPKLVFQHTKSIVE